MSTELHFETVPLAKVPSTDVIKTNHRPIVLIVDDEEIIADTRVAIFSSWGCAAIAAYSSEAALAIARETSPDLLISDVTLAGINGVELAIEIQKNAPNCKVLLVSGHLVSTDLLAQANHVGRNFILLTKPVRPAEIAASLAELNFQWPGRPNSVLTSDLSFREIA